MIGGSLRSSNHLSSGCCDPYSFAAPPKCACSQPRGVVGGRTGWSDGRGRSGWWGGQTGRNPRTGPRGANARGPVATAGCWRRFVSPRHSAGFAPAVPMIETRMMLGSVLGIAVARPLPARSAAPRMVISASPTIAEYPSPALSPWDVVASQISALQAEDSAPHPKPTALWRRTARLELTRVPCRGRRAHLPLRIARGQAHDGKDEAHGGAFPSQPFRLPVASPSRPLVGATRL